MELLRETWVDAGEACKRIDVALLPVGSVENHGPHLPLGTDSLTAEYLARTAEAAGQFLRLPCVPVGLSSEHRQFPGTLWVDRDSLMRYVRQILLSLATHGVRRVILVNGHGGNTEALQEVCRSLRDRAIYAFVFQWWTAIRDTVKRICVAAPDHAGDMETSVLLHIGADHVRRARAAEAEASGARSWGRVVHGVSVGFDTIDFTRSGATGCPTAASADKGRRLMEAAVAELVSFGTWLSAQDDRALSVRPHLV